MSNKIIHIVAESEILSVYEFCSEDKAVKRLTQILESFKKLNSRPSIFKRFPGAKLKVRTCVANPEFNFYPASTSPSN